MALNSSSRLVLLAACLVGMLLVWLSLLMPVVWTPSGPVEYQGFEREWR